MKISREEILHIAELSRLSFTDEELDELGEQLGNVLERFRQLDAVDVSDVPPTAHILDFVNVLREDEARSPMSKEELLKNAPESDGSAYIVPRVLE